MVAHTVCYVWCWERADFLLSFAKVNKTVHLNSNRISLYFWCLLTLNNRTEREKLLWQQQKSSMRWLQIMHTRWHITCLQGMIWHGLRMCVEYAIKHLSHRFQHKKKKRAKIQTVAETNALVVTFFIAKHVSTTDQLKCSRWDDKSKQNSWNK